MSKLRFWKKMRNALMVAFVAVVGLGCAFIHTGNAAAESVATPKAVTVEDIFDVTENKNGEGNGVSVYRNTTETSAWEIGKSSVTENFEFVSHVTLNTIGSQRGVPLGILLNEEREGYWFNIQYPSILSTGEEFAYIELYDGALAYRTQAVALKRARASVETEWYNVFYGTEGFDLRFGAQDYYVGDTFSYTYVYVYINGELYMEYKDTTKNALADNIAVDDSWSRVTYTAPAKAKPVTVEDIYDVTKNATGTGVYSWKNTGAADYAFGKSSVTENFEFSTHVTLASFILDGTKLWGVPLGILLNENNEGYWFIVQYPATASGEEFAYIELYDGALTHRTKPEAVVVKQARKSVETEWYNVFYSADGFDLRFGAVDYYVGDTFSYTYVYVYINGELYMEYKDTTKNVTGQNMGGDNGGGRVTYLSTASAKAMPVTVEDIYDVTKNATGTGVYSWKNTGAADYAFGKSSVTENFEFSTHVTLASFILDSTKLWGVPLGILLNENNEGYWFMIQYPRLITDTEDTEFAYIELYDGALTHRTKPEAVVVKQARKSVETEWYNVFYSVDGFDLRFGAVDYYVGDTFSYTQVYVYINGELYMEYKDTTKNVTGQNMGGDNGGGRVTYLSTAKAEEKPITVEDIYDVTGNNGNAIPSYSNPNATQWLLGKTGVEENYEFTGVIALNLRTWMNFPLGILLTEPSKNGEGYWFDISCQTNRDGSANARIRLHDGAFATSTVVATSTAKAEWYDASGYEIRFGAVDCYRDKTFSQFMYTKVYVIINGEQVFEYLDATKNQHGEYVAGDEGNARVGIYSSKDANWRFDPVETVDWYDVTGQFSTVYGHTGNEMTVGELPTRKNISFETKLTFGDIEFSEDYTFQITFMKEGSALYSKAGYRLTITDTQLLLRADRHQVNMSTDFATTTRPDCIGPGKTVLLEIGTQKAYMHDAYAGDKIFVKINGVECLSFIDTEPHEHNGVFVLSPLGNQVGGYAEFATTRATATFTCEDPLVGFEEYTLFADDDYTLYIPVAVGYMVTKVTVDGNEVEFVSANGGVTVAFKAGETGGKIAVETMEKALTFGVTGTEDYTAVGVENGELPYGGNVTVSIARPNGKTLSGLTVNGIDKLSAVIADGDRYCITLYAVVENTEIVCTFTDVPSYSVTVTQVENGNITVSATTVREGDRVTIKVTAAEGYRVLSLIVNGNKVSIDGNGEYVLENVRENVSVTAEYLSYAPVSQENTDKGCASTIGIASMGGGAVCVALFAGLTLLRKRKKDE